MVSTNAASNGTEKSTVQSKYPVLETTNFGTASSKGSPEARRRESSGSERDLPSVDDSKKIATAEVIPAVHVSGSHYEIGHGIGERFAGMIKSRFEKDEKLNEILLPYAATDAGRTVVDELSTENKKCYPRYWEELQGLADGSGIAFQQVLLMNIWKELFLLLPPPDAQAVAEEPDHCSDVLICNENLAVVGHNEDAAASVRGHTYLVYATLPDGASYTAFTYSGELCCPAFGFNSHGMAFSLNAVNPTGVKPGGVARNFVSRDLLEARSLEDAVQRVTRVPIAVGHNYNIMDFNQRRIVTVETASDGRSSVLEIGPHPYFHSNHYLRLPLPQRTPPTTVRRLERAAVLRPPASISDVLSILGDAADAEFPIYMTGPLLVTLCSALFDLDSRTVTILGGNPTLQHVLLKERI
ncbi:hypothetical protein KFL_000020730 [Klebsormidium nitens]|uniref:Peptidase C45 hydrolase domain-containing protein n=1 Tax=Klebsormidium nitens TaxID=105231 RepID=A0A1Y1HJJ9_KLENI|nr:hypothetical protein KFL_000020730 [Klebsormidium nitens]|eukprot:GAQ77712.1 hypothetical protein KFL_000020730 [Klebsormidium nitens]